MSNLDRIEKLLNINNDIIDDQEGRLLIIFNKLSEYMSNTKSMLYECLLTLAETVNNAQEREESTLLEEDEEEEEQYKDDQNEDEDDQNEDEQQLSDEGSIISK